MPAACGTSASGCSPEVHAERPAEHRVGDDAPPLTSRWSGGRDPHLQGSEVIELQQLSPGLVRDTRVETKSMRTGRSPAAAFGSERELDLGV